MHKTFFRSNKPSSDFKNPPLISFAFPRSDWTPIRRDIAVRSCKSQLHCWPRLFVPRWNSSDVIFAIAYRIDHMPLFLFPIHSPDAISLSQSKRYRYRKPSLIASHFYPNICFTAFLIFSAKPCFTANPCFYRKSFVYHYIAFSQNRNHICIKALSHWPPPTRYNDRPSAVRFTPTSNGLYYIASPHIASSLSRRFSLFAIV